jgi:hypothetical protein
VIVVRVACMICDKCGIKYEYVPPEGLVAGVYWSHGRVCVVVAAFVPGKPLRVLSVESHTFGRLVDKNGDVVDADVAVYDRCNKLSRVFAHEDLMWVKQVIDRYTSSPTVYLHAPAWVTARKTYGRLYLTLACILETYTHAGRWMGAFGCSPLAIADRVEDDLLTTTQGWPRESRKVERCTLGLLLSQLGLVCARPGTEDDDCKVLGKSTHEHLTGYVKGEGLPRKEGRASKIARLAIPHLPNPKMFRDCSVEVLRKLPSHKRNEGLRKDLEYVDERGWGVVYDYKTVADPAYAHSPESLLQDRKALTYALETFARTGVSKVELRWLYMSNVEDKAWVVSAELDAPTCLANLVNLGVDVAALLRPCTDV